MLKYRLITGPILIAAVILLVILDERLDSVTLSPFWQDVFNGKKNPPRGLVFFGFAALVAAPLAAWELANIFRAQGIATRTWLTALAAMLGVTLSYAIPMNTSAIIGIAIVSTGMIVIFVAAILTFSQNKNVHGVVAAAGAIVFAMVYLGLMMGFFLALRREHSAWWIVGIVLTTKMADTGAYFTGSSIGRHKLIPWISPGKTWEGFIGGVIASMAVGLLLSWISQQFLSPRDHVPLHWGAVFGAVFGVVGQFGDLVKSLLKRGAGIKDSSALLPGLGGVLDVVDSPLMVAPVAFWLIYFVLPS